MRIVPLLLAVACVFGVAAATAGAHPGKPTVIAFTIQDLGDASAACDDSLFGLSFTMESLDGQLLGTGMSCVHGVVGCQFAAGCRDTTDATFTLAFERGSVTAPVVLKEHWLTNTTVFQREHGAISSGTGDFAGAAGSIHCAGLVQFTELEAIPSIACVARVH